MCIAIYNNNNELPFEVIENCFRGNPDGAGLLFVKKDIHGMNSIHTFKSFNLQQFYKSYLEALNHAKDGKVVLHFRIGTSGKLSKTNIHPFLNWQNRLGFVHNGVIREFSTYQFRRGLSKTEENYSDTWHFNKKIVSNLPATFMKSVRVQKELERYLNSQGWNKMIFMDESARVAILNAKLGVYEGENWFSNDSYLGINRYAGNRLL
jgi:predicted glutamine amidotransferase